MREKKQEFKLRTLVDIKVFILFLLDNMRGDPVEESALIAIVSENTDTIVTEYNECLVELRDAGQIDYDTVDGLTYYMISPKGHAVAKELYDSLDEGFLRRGLVYANRYMSLARAGATASSAVEETEDGRYRVKLAAKQGDTEIFRLELLFTTRKEANDVRAYYDARPDRVYRAILFASSGKVDFLT